MAIWAIGTMNNRQITKRVETNLQVMVQAPAGVDCQAPA